MRTMAVRAARVGAAGVLSACMTACIDGSAFLNPDFATALGLSEQAASLPGEAPTLLIEVENRTSRPIDFQLSWRDGDGNPTFRINSVQAGEKVAEAVVCPVAEITLGDVGDLSATGAVVVLGSGNAGDPFIEVEAFGRLLQETINYDCGDAVNFTVLPSGATASGYQIFAFIRRG